MAESWQWIFAVIGLVAFLMAIQPFTQFIWGRPKIEIWFEARDINSLRVLDIFLRNPPIRNRLLIILGVRRMVAEDIGVTFNIKDVRTGNIIRKLDVASLRTAREGNKCQISLPSSLVPAVISLVQASNDGITKLRYLGNEKEDWVKLNPGKYELELTVHCSESTIKKNKIFSVGSQPYDLFWE